MIPLDLAERLRGQCDTAAKIAVSRLDLPQQFVDELSSDVAFYVIKRWRNDPLEILIQQEGTIERFGRLTERERQTIEAVADLGSYAAAAEFLDLSTTRIRALVAKARRKLTEDA
jgi:DNA-directed RNA polymerase specialized sigma24 family protein